MKKLEYTHHFCLKHIQGLPARTRSDIITGLVGITSLEAYIDLQKLSFLGTLCRAGPDDIVSKLFAVRFFQHSAICTNRSFGFIPDIKRILSKYDLETYLTDYLTSGIFPTKHQWKSAIKLAIFNRECYEWCIRTQGDSDFTRFKLVNNSLEICNAWKVCKKHPESLKEIKHLVRLCCTLATGETTTCKHCGRLYRDQLQHNLFDCHNYDILRIREQYFHSISRTFSIELSTFLHRTTREKFSAYLLGRYDSNLMELINENNYSEFLVFNSKFVRSLYRM